MKLTLPVLCAMGYLEGSARAASNLRKHGVSFEEAATALADDYSITGADQRALNR